MGGTLLSIFGLVAAMSPAQQALPGAAPNAALPGGLPPALPANMYPAPRPRYALPPHRPIRSQKDAMEYYKLLQQTPRPHRVANLRAAINHIAGMPTVGAGNSGGPGSMTVHPPTGGSSFSSNPANFAPSSFNPASLSFNPLAAPPIGPILPIAGGVWQNIAPKPLNPLDIIFFGPSYVTGRINACTYDPTNSSVAYIAAPVGGIWKTVNAGASWTPITESLTTQSFSSLTVDPTNHNTLYAGSGDYDGSDESGAGLFRSQDGGQTWQNLDPDGSVFADHSIRQVLVDPSNPNNVLVAVGRNGNAYYDTQGGIYRTTNALSPNPTFTAALNADGNCHNLVYNADRSIVYAAIESYDSYYNYVFTGVPTTSGVYSSTDNGVTWNQVYTTIWFTDVAASKINPGVVYAVDGLTDQVLKSTDSGVTWNDTTSNFPQALDPMNGSDHAWDQSFYDMYIATSTQPGLANAGPGGPASAAVAPPVDVVYVGLKDTYQSPNAGRTWGAVGQVSLAPNSFTFTDQMHTDQHAIGIDPSNPSNILLGNDGGVYHLHYNATNNLNSLSDLNASLVVTEFYQTVFHPSSANTILGGSQDNGTSYSFGSLFGWNGVTGGDGSGVAINAQTPATMYSCYPGDYSGTTANIHVNLTDNNWQTVTDISHGAPMENAEFVQVIALDPQNYDHLYAGTNNLWLYDHAAKSWTEILDSKGFNKPLTVNGTVSAIAPAGIPAQGFEPFVYVGCSDGSLYTVVPDQMNPTSAVRIFFNIQLHGSITSIVVSRVNPRRIFVTTNVGEVYRCDDAINTVNYIDITGAGLATNPTHLPPGLPINTVALAQQDDERVVFVGTDLGVFASSDAGATWGTLSVPYGMPNTKINNLDFNATTGYLSAGTFGRGIWRIALTDLPATIYQKATLHFAPVLPGYRGAKNKLQCLVELRKPGSLNTSLPVETHTVTMLANGTFDVPVSARGHYDVYLTIPRFLRKKQADVVTTSAPLLNPVLVCGDCASPPKPVTPPAVPGPPLLGADNVIDANDVALLRANLGLYTNSILDLDGDGRVTSNDVAIASANQGKRGD